MVEANIKAELLVNKKCKENIIEKTKSNSSKCNQQLLQQMEQKLLRLDL